MKRRVSEVGEEKIRPGPGGLLAPSDHEGDTGHPEHLVAPVNDHRSS